MKKIILLFALLNIFLANAQWQADTAVNTLAASTITVDTQSISTSDGQTYVAFYKRVDPPVNYEMRLQLLNANGEKQFGDEGILVSNTIPMSTYTFIWRLYKDKNNNVYIALTSTGAGNNGYVFKYNTAGESLWEGGINLGTGLVPAVLPLSTGEVLISWWPGTKGMIQRYTAEGAPVWSTPIEVVPAANYSTKGTIVADMFEMANGDFTATFHTKLSYQVNSLFYAQRYNSAGVAQWAVPTQLSDKNTAYNTYYNSAQEGDVIYYGYTLITGSRFDSFAQRLNADGTTPWGLNGIDFDINATYYEMYTKLAFEPGTQYLYTTATYTGSAQGAAGQFIQKFDKVTGARQFTDHAKEVFAINDQHRVNAGDMYLLNGQPLFLIKDGFDSGVTPVTLNAVFLDTDGNFILPNHFMPVATYPASKGSVTLNKPYDNHAVVTFTEQKTADEDRIYAQKFTTVLNCTITTTPLADITADCSLAFANVTAPVITDSCGNTITGTISGNIFPITHSRAIEWIFTSPSGVTASQMQNVIINSTLTPAALADITSTCAVTELTAPVTTDSCGNVLTAITEASLPITQGTTVVTWYYFTTSDAVVTQTQNVIVNNTVAPTLILGNINAPVEEDATIFITPQMFDNGSTDACGLDAYSAWTWTMSPEEFTCSDLGVQNVTITVTDINGNTSTATATVTITDPNNYCQTAGTGEFEQKKITMYPNPTQDVFNISSPDTINSVVVYDMLGKIVYRSSVSADSATIDTKAWSTGVYNVAVETASGEQQKLKLVKN